MSEEEIVTHEQAEQCIDSLFQFSLHDIGSSSFLKEHEALQKLNMQAHRNLSFETEEFISELLTTYSKYDLLIHNLFVLEMFRKNLQKRLVGCNFGDEEHELKAEILLYSIFFHESVVFDLLSTRVVDQVFESKYLPELVDYVADCLNQVISGDYTCDYKADPLAIAAGDELRHSLADLDFKRNVTAFVVLRGLACNNLPLQTQYRLKTDRLQVKAAQILALPAEPWIREVTRSGKVKALEIFECLEWKRVDDLEAVRFTLEQTPAELYIALLGLARLNENFTSAEIDVLSALKGKILDSFCDEIADLRELRVYYEKICLNRDESALQQVEGRIQDEFGTGDPQKPILVEVVSNLPSKIKEEAKARILEHNNAKKSKAIEKQVGSDGVISLTSDEELSLADDALFEAIYDAVISRIDAFDIKTETVCDEYDKVFPICICGKIARQRCARCKKVWYCSRECQVKDWKSGHKNVCKPLEEVNE